MFHHPVDFSAPAMSSVSLGRNPTYRNGVPGDAPPSARSNSQNARKSSLKNAEVLPFGDVGDFKAVLTSFLACTLAVGTRAAQQVPVGAPRSISGRCSGDFLRDSSDCQHGGLSTKWAPSTAPRSALRTLGSVVATGDVRRWPATEAAGLFTVPQAKVRLNLEPLL